MGAAVDPDGPEYPTKAAARHRWAPAGPGSRRPISAPNDIETGGSRSRGGTLGPPDGTGICTVTSCTFANDTAQNPLIDSYRINGSITSLQVTWDVTVDVTAVTLDAQACPTGGSMHGLIRYPDLRCCPVGLQVAPSLSSPSAKMSFRADPARR